MKSLGFGGFQGLGLPPGCCMPGREYPVIVDQKKPKPPSRRAGVEFPGFRI